MRQQNIRYARISEADDCQDLGQGEGAGCGGANQDGNPIADIVGTKQGSGRSR